MVITNKFKSEPEILLHCTKVNTLVNDDDEMIENRRKQGGGDHCRKNDE